MTAPAGIRLDHAILHASDRAQTAAFYRDVLGADVVDLPYGRLGLAFGDQRLNVHLPDSTPQPRALHPPGPGSGDFCFVWPGTPADAIAHLEAHGVDVIEGPVERDCARGRGLSVYFRDPDGSLLELVSYSQT